MSGAHCVGVVVVVVVLLLLPPLLALVLVLVVFHANCGRQATSGRLGCPLNVVVMRRMGDLRRDGCGRAVCHACARVSRQQGGRFNATDCPHAHTHTHTHTPHVRTTRGRRLLIAVVCDLVGGLGQVRVCVCLRRCGLRLLAFLRL